MPKETIQTALRHSNCHSVAARERFEFRRLTRPQGRRSSNNSSKNSTRDTSECVEMNNPPPPSPLLTLSRHNSNNRSNWPRRSQRTIWGGVRQVVANLLLWLPRLFQLVLLDRRLPVRTPTLIRHDRVAHPSLLLLLLLRRLMLPPPPSLPLSLPLPPLPCLPCATYLPFTRSVLRLAT